MSEFTKFMKENQEKMDLYTQTVAKVHGKSHPEIVKVREIYQDLMLHTDDDNIDLNDTFQQLREITDDYKVPSDVCETYQAVYQNLEQADAIYMEPAQ